MRSEAAAAWHRAGLEPLRGVIGNMAWWFDGDVVRLRLHQSNHTLRKSYAKVQVVSTSAPRCLGCNVLRAGHNINGGRVNERTRKRWKVVEGGGVVGGTG